MVESIKSQPITQAIPTNILPNSPSKFRTMLSSSKFLVGLAATAVTVASALFIKNYLQAKCQQDLKNFGENQNSDCHAIRRLIPMCDSLDQSHIRGAVLFERDCGIDEERSAVFSKFSTTVLRDGKYDIWNILQEEAPIKKKREVQKKLEAEQIVYSQTPINVKTGKYLEGLRSRNLVYPIEQLNFDIEEFVQNEDLKTIDELIDLEQFLKSDSDSGKNADILAKYKEIFDYFAKHSTNPSFVLEVIKKMEGTSYNEQVSELISNYKTSLGSKLK